MQTRFPSRGNNVATWSAQDRSWMLSLFGTAVGAGILFLPIDAGLHGFWPLVALTILVGPMTYLSHHGLALFVLSSRKPGSDITEVVEEHFGGTAGTILTLLYFLAIYPIVLIYCVGATNTVDSFVVNQLGIKSMPRPMLSIILILGMISIMSTNEKLVLKVMEWLIYPLVAILVFLSVYLIPYWNLSALHHIPTASEFVLTLWISIPVMIFSFNHSPAISSFSLAQEREYGDGAEHKASQILGRTSGMLSGFVMSFVFSCVLALTPRDLAKAKAQNLSVLSYLANKHDSPFIACLGPVVAFIAIVSSFCGHYMGAREGLNGLVIKHLRSRGKAVSKKKVRKFTVVFVIVTCWVVAAINPSILGMIETLGGPIIAAILFIMPMYAIKKVPAMQKHAGKKSNSFVMFVGLIGMSAIIYKLML